MAETLPDAEEEKQRGGPEPQRWRVKFVGTAPQPTPRCHPYLSAGRSVRTSRRRKEESAAGKYKAALAKRPQVSRGAPAAGSEKEVGPAAASMQARSSIGLR